MSKTKWYHKPIYLLVALALALSLGIAALPMAGTVEAAANGDITVNIHDMAGTSLSAGTNVKADLWGTYWDGASWQWFHMVKAANATGSVTWTASEITSNTTAVPDSVYYLVTVWGGDPFANSQVGGTGGNWILYDSSAAAKNWNVRTFTTSIEGTASSFRVIFAVDLADSTPTSSAVAVDISYEGCSHDVQPAISATTKSNMEADGYTFSFDSGSGLLTIQHPGTGYNQTFSARVDGSGGYIAELETLASLPGVYDEVAKEFSVDIDYPAIGLAQGDTFFALCFFYFSGPEAGLEVCTHNGYVGHMLHPYIVPPHPSSVWIDDDYSEGSCGGHVWNQDAFDTIQEGISAVADAGTVYTATGTYNERITINQSLTLQASSSPIIDGGGSGAAVTINATNVGVIGFTIQNAATGILATSGTGNEIHCCNIVNNANWALNNTSGNLVDATHNWWGDASGPYDPNGTVEVPPCTDNVTAEKNTDGTGDNVTDNVDYCPWLGAEVVGCECDFVEDGTLDAKEEADTEVDVDGSANVTAAEFDSNPEGGLWCEFGKFIDVSIDDDANVTQIEIRLYYTDAEIEGLVESSLRLYWWDGSSWVECSNTGVNTAAVNSYSGYIWAIIDATSTPNLSQLQGTPFGGGGSPPPVPRVPATTHWGILAMIALFAGLLVWTVRRRRLAS